MCRYCRHPLVLTLVLAATAVAIIGLSAFAGGEPLRILVPRSPSVHGWGGASDLDPVWELGASLHESLSEPWGFEILLEDVAMETLTVAWVLDRRMRGVLEDVAVVPLWLARELSERRQLIALDDAPRIDPGYFLCDPWDPLFEIPEWVRLVNVNPVPYSDVENPWACREAIRIPGTGEYVIVLFDPEGIYEDPDAYICHRSAIIRNSLALLRDCVGD